MTDPGRPYEVLVVDDDFMVADIHRRFVDATPGFRTIGVVHTAADAVAAVRTIAPDLVLLDVHLPDRSGLDALQRLRSEGNDVAVVVVTAARELDTVRRALRGGAADYLVKPFEYPQLLEKLENVRQRARALSDSNGMDQSVIDSLFGAPKQSTPQHLPKGLSQETGSLVLRTVGESGEVSARECADLAGLSRVSAQIPRALRLDRNPHGPSRIRPRWKAGTPIPRHRLIQRPRTASRGVISPALPTHTRYDACASAFARSRARERSRISSNLVA